jgi:flagellar hook-length control protein FliK
VTGDVKFQLEPATAAPESGDVSSTTTTVGGSPATPKPAGTSVRNGNKSKSASIADSMAQANLATDPANPMLLLLQSLGVQVASAPAATDSAKPDHGASGTEAPGASAIKSDAGNDGGSGAAVAALVNPSPGDTSVNVATSSDSTANLAGAAAALSAAVAVASQPSAIAATDAVAAASAVAATTAVAATDTSALSNAAASAAKPAESDSVVPPTVSTPAGDGGSSEPSKPVTQAATPAVQSSDSGIPQTVPLVSSIPAQAVIDPGVVQIVTSPAATPAVAQPASPATPYPPAAVQLSAVPAVNLPNLAAQIVSAQPQAANLVLSPAAMLTAAANSTAPSHGDDAALSPFATLFQQISDSVLKPADGSGKATADAPLDLSALMMNAAAASIGSPSTQTSTSDGSGSFSSPDAMLQTNLHAPLDATQDNWPDMLGSRIEWLLHHGLQEAHIELHPREMGSINVHVRLGADGADVRFAATNPNIRDALESSLPRLRELLASGGLALAQAQVGSQMQQQESAGRFTQQNPTPRSSANAPAATADAAKEESAAPRVRVTQVSIVDAYA